jgi:hypothetical protein
MLLTLFWCSSADSQVLLYIGQPGQLDNPRLAAWDINPSAGKIDFIPAV